MRTLLEIDFELIVLVTAVTISLLTMWRRKLLTPAALQIQRPRRTGITALDLITGLLLLLAGPMLLGPILAQVGLLPSPGAAPAGVMAFAVQVVIGQLLTYTLPVLYLLYRASRQSRGLTELGLIPRRPVRDVITAGLGFLAILPITMAATLVMVTVSVLITGEQPPAIGHETLAQLQQSLQQQQFLALALLLLAALVLAPVLEELIFRGLVQSALLDLLGPGRRWMVVILAGLLFTLIHLGSVQWQTLTGLFVLAIGLGWLYERTGSLLPSMLVHVAFNAFNTMIALLMEPGRP